MGSSTPLSLRRVKTIMDGDGTDHSLKESPKQKKSKVEELSNSLSIHGLPNIFVASHISQRLIWLLMFLGGLATLTWMTYTRTYSYLQREVVWKDTNNAQSSIAFPMIAICDYRIGRANISPVTIELRSCQIEHEDCMPDIEVIYTFGNACTYINTSAIHQELPGPEFGLQLSFAVADTPPPKGDMKATYTQISLELHLFEEGYYPWEMKSRLLLSPKYHHDIPIEKWIVNRLPAPYPSKCKNGTMVSTTCRNPSLPNCNSTVSNNCSTQTYVYHDEACYNQITLVEGIPAYCNNTEYALYHDPDQTLTILKCLMHELNEGNDTDDETHCPLPCHKISYHATISRLPWPEIFTQSDAFQAMREGTTREKVKELDEQDQGRIKPSKSVMSMNIFYRDLSVVKFEETPMYTIPSLVSDVGGLMGLFLGASVYSLVELLLLIFVTIFDKCCICLQKKPNPKSDKDGDI